MEKETNKYNDQFELLTQSHGRHLLIAVLKRDRNAFKGTRFQFIRNHPLIRLALEGSY